MTSWLHEQRLEAVLATIAACGAETVLDLGCGDGALLTRLVRNVRIRRIVGVDLSGAALARLRARLRDEPEDLRGKVDLIHDSMAARGKALGGFDLAVLLETIEHIEPDRLSAVEHTVFREMRPATVVITTPNADFNPLLEVPAHRFRHPDHRFEWGRERFGTWARGVGRRNGYGVACRDLGGSHPRYGGASQMALFSRSTPNRKVA